MGVLHVLVSSTHHTFALQQGQIPLREAVRAVEVPRGGRDNMKAALVLPTCIVLSVLGAVVAGMSVTPSRASWMSLARLIAESCST